MLAKIRGRGGNASIMRTRHIIDLLHSIADTPPTLRKRYRFGCHNISVRYSLASEHKEISPMLTRALQALAYEALAQAIGSH
jgi:hypothetical protein